ncbi:hypothetical protein [Cellulomonas wangsupingiae]|uniref:Uncharacterized protein n=1 Tax=Cellulomonas wangsupingiae TaxID=2968085 RepID=A0ABY5K6F0_9CELL|nr:hypothetical protein [Cellulomonas wangsupingiae]MCC2334862.1 hypothetical protein [Cellulomonas wangsupingiae]MCM0638735.1 hypothetical protein [Cellulomonas wangsupingiae]UUI65364.1 hypothetical protein NP075_01075 [Cellulomonas wangsupingiae]
MSNYWNMEALSDLYLEDSWILDIVARPGLLEFAVEFVLRDSHPLYQPPMQGERHSYRPGALRFLDVRSLSWTHQGEISPATDATGERDYGSIDSWEQSTDTHTLIGDFGHIVVVASAPLVEYQDGDTLSAAF